MCVQCAGCGQRLRDGQALVALDKQFHIWCFKCRQCGVLLHGEYMGHEGEVGISKLESCVFIVRIAIIVSDQMMKTHSNPNPPTLNDLMAPAISLVLLTQLCSRTVSGITTRSSE